MNPYVPRVLLRHLAVKPEELWWTIEGSVVFVDISGFTKLSEKLAKVGKEGAEQVTDAIEACFTDLLSVAYANDGSLIKFGGDALLLLFEDGDHVANACRSAVWMRRALRDVGRIELPGGAHLQLRMSVGVHTGTYNFFHVGGSHRELVVTGPGWTGTVAMEHVADAGEILVSPQVAAVLPTRCIGEAKGPGFLLKREPPGHHAAADMPRYEAEPEAVAGCLSTAVRAHVLGGGGTPEHRAISIAFIHFDGTDEAIAERGPSAVANDLQVLLADTQAACDEFGVCFLATDADDDGGKLILTAGAPTITGNDEERMLLALRKIADRERAIPIRIGVNRGSVFAGDIGPWYRRTYTVMGDAVNLAARLMAKAAPGEIYATAEVLDASATRFATTELEPFMVKGKAKPVQAWAVGAVVGTRARDAAVHLPLIGRDEELATLHGVSPVSGDGHIVELVGEAGIGKSRLLDELRTSLPEIRELVGTAEAFTSSTPFAVWRGILRELLEVGWEDPDDVVLARLRATVAERDPALLPWLPLLAIPLDTNLAPTPEVEQLSDAFRQSKLHDTVIRFLEVTLDVPALISVEDAHLMDGSSSELLTALVDRVAAHPWLVATTRREGEGGFTAPDHPRAISIRLEPLAEDDLNALALAATEDAPLLPHDLQTVAERSGGNPQFLLDLVQVVGSGSMLPESVETAAMARIDELMPADRTIVRRASVLGARFHPRFLADVLAPGSPPPDEATWARLAEFFQDAEDGYLRFRRAVVRDAAYAALPFRLRRHLHAQLAQRFEQEYDPGETGGLLSLHYFLAGTYDKAWTYARMAGKRAADQFANQEAAKLYRRAIDAARRLPDADLRELATTYEAMAHCHVRSGAHKQAADAFGMARRLYEGDPIAEARTLFERSKVEDSLGRYSQALRWATRARTRLDGRPDAEAMRQRARIDAWYATILQSAGRLAEAIPWCRQAIEEAEKSGEPRALAQANFVLGWSDFVLGRPGASHMAEALSIYEDLGDLAGQAHMSVNLGAAAYYEGRWDDARSVWERGSELFQAVGDVGSAAMGDVNISQVLTDQGRLDEATPLIRASIRLYRASGDRYLLGSSLSQYARVLARSGRCGESIPIFEEAHEELTTVGAQAEALESDAMASEARVFLERPDEALEQADATLKGIEAIGGDSVATPLLHRVRGFAFAQLGRTVEAEEAFTLSVQSARDRGSDFDVALGQIALERLARMQNREVDPVMHEETWKILERLGVVAVAVDPLRPVENV
ncbi:MAG: tetratricopeptide repeat protein [Actinomycetota bacterium]